MSRRWLLFICVPKSYVGYFLYNRILEENCYECYHTQAKNSLLLQNTRLSVVRRFGLNKLKDEKRKFKKIGGCQPFLTPTPLRPLIVPRTIIDTKI